MNKENLRREMMECLNEYGHTYTEEQIEKYIDSWVEAKGDLIDTLRRHPQWNENQMAVSFDYDTERGIDLNAYKDLFKAIMLLWEKKMIGKEMSIREWDELVENESLDSYGDIRFKNFSGCINGSFKRYCGTRFTVSSFKNHEEVYGRTSDDEGVYIRLLDSNYHQIYKIYITLLIHAFKNELSAEIIAKLNSWGLKCAQGQKFSRIVNKFFEMLGVTKEPEYNKLFAQLSDAINPIKVTRHTLLSVHPCDFLLMSNGGDEETEGWKSCHNIRNGCHMAGTLSYLLDKVSMVFYTVSNKYNGEVMWNQPKINRQMFMYQNNMLLQSRLYPKSQDNQNIMNFRESVQKIFADCLDIPNLWVRKDDVNEIGEIVHTKEGALNYADYAYSEYNITLSAVKGNEFTEMTVGEVPKCLICGGQITQSGNLKCMRFHDNDPIKGIRRVRTDIYAGDIFSGVMFVEPMKQYRGMQVTLVRELSHRNWSIYEDENRFTWNEAMFEPEPIEASTI